MKKNKEKQIIDFLKKNGRSSITRIADEIKSNHWMTNKYLEKLERECQIIKEKETRSTYWRLVDSEDPKI